MDKNSSMLQMKNQVSEKIKLMPEHKKQLTVRIHEVINGGGNCSIAGGVQLYLGGLRVGTP